MQPLLLFGLSDQDETGPRGVRLAVVATWCGTILRRDIEVSIADQECGSLVREPSTVRLRRSLVTSPRPSLQSLCSAARTNSIKVTGVVTVMKIAIRTSCSTNRVCNTEK